MNENLKKEIKDVDSLIERGEYDSAVKMLRKLAEEHPDEGEIPYYLGRISLVGKDEELALQYFLTAERMNYINAELYFSIGMLCNDLNIVNDAEKYMLKTLDLSEKAEDKWACISALAFFYVNHDMYLKAEKMAKKLLKEYPDNYQGHHVHIIIESLKGHYDEVNAYMEMLPDEFKRHPQYLIDIIEVYKQQERESELLELLEKDSRFDEIIPQVVLREKISRLSNEESIDEKEKLVVQLAKEYQDSDAIVSSMILAFSKKDFKRSSEIANIVLENEKENQGVKYYLAIYFQMFNFYFLADKKPSEELRRWIEKVGNWCIEFTDSLQIAEIGDTVRNSIQELFDEINEIE